MSSLPYTLEHVDTNGDDASLDGTLEYTMSPIIPATYWEPAEGGEVELDGFYLKDGTKAEMTDAEYDAAYEFVCDRGEPDEPYDPYGE